MHLYFLLLKMIPDGKVNRLIRYSEKLECQTFLGTLSLVVASLTGQLSTQKPKKLIRLPVQYFMITTDKTYDFEPTKLDYAFFGHLRRGLYFRVTDTQP